MDILELSLQTHRLAEQRAFYVDMLRLPLLAESSDTLTLRVGTTRLIFERAPSGRPTYHFAFNIPENQLAAGKRWIAASTALLSRDGTDQYTFPAWNADAAYFRDPAGNLGEIIARHNLPNATSDPFGAHSLLCVSEIGLVTPNVEADVDRLIASFGLHAPYGRSASFAAVGSDSGLFIVVPPGRPWFTTDAPAEAHPTTVLFRAPEEATQQFSDLPYVLHSRR